MLNPNDVANKKFEKYMGKGYRQDEVDGYLRQLAGDITTLLEDKQALERKIEVLADKLMEYKDDEDSLRAALIGAQKLGDTVIRESKDKAARILDEANAKANSIVQDAQRNMEREQVSYTRLQHEVAAFKSRLQLMYKQHLELISTLPAEEVSATVVPPQPTPQAVDPRQREREYDITPVAEDAQPVHERMFFESNAVRQEDSQEFSAVEYMDDEEDDDDLMHDDNRMEDTAELPELEYEEDNNHPPVGKYESRFGTLKFGSQYNIKRENDKRKK